jgi:hypothetical protein
MSAAGAFADMQAQDVAGRVTKGGDPLKVGKATDIFEYYDNRTTIALQRWADRKLATVSKKLVVFLAKHG